MNTIKISNPVRLIAFFLTAVILVCTFGFTVDGWQNSDVAEKPQNSGLTDKEDNGNTDEPTDSVPVPEEPEIYIPEYINYLTGLETTEDISKKAALAFIMESGEACYGISRSDLLIEIPIENDKTRLISFITDRTDLWKIGCLSSGRGYITNLAKFFGAISVFNGIDDQMSYTSCDVSFSSLDLKLKNGYHYTEFSSKVYSNCDLISSGLSSSGIKETKNEEAALPFFFVDFGKEKQKYENKAVKSKITQADGSNLELVYNSENEKYSYIKNSSIMADALNGKALEFTNCFVLFADSVTYDNSTCSQIVMDTIGSGSGYYLTKGSYTEIKWTATETGVMSFYLPEGERLTVNRGNSYICYLKASRVDSVSFS